MKQQWKAISNQHTLPWAFTRNHRPPIVPGLFSSHCEPDRVGWLWCEWAAPCPPCSRRCHPSRCKSPLGEWRQLYLLQHHRDGLMERREQDLLHGKRYSIIYVVNLFLYANINIRIYIHTCCQVLLGRTCASVIFCERWCLCCLKFTSYTHTYIYIHTRWLKNDIE